MKWSPQPGSVAVLVLQEGEIILDWGETRQKYWVHSIRKSFLSSLIGIALEEGRLSLKTELREYAFLSASLSEVEERATLRDLISSRSGIYLPAAAADRERPPRGLHRPGEAWFYNNWGFNAVQEILEQTYGCDIFHLFFEKIAKRVGIENFHPGRDGIYVGSPDCVPRAGFFRMDSVDLMKFGQLYLKHGVVGEEVVLSNSWIQESTSFLSPTDLGNGYGYMWWVSGREVSIPGMRNCCPDLYYAWGWGGHYLVVVPSRNMVVVHRVDSNDTEKTVHVHHEAFGRLLEDLLN